MIDARQHNKTRQSFCVSIFNLNQQICLVSPTLLHSCHLQPYLCEASYILLEYAKTAMFLWMFIEGLYLHNVVTVTVFQGRFPHLIYAIAGWGSPVLITVSMKSRTVTRMKPDVFFYQGTWSAVMAIYKSDIKCWYGYSLMPYYWILEGPRLVVILVSFIIFYEI